MFSLSSILNYICPIFSEGQNTNVCYIYFQSNMTLVKKNDALIYDLLWFNYVLIGIIG